MAFAASAVIALCYVGVVSLLNLLVSDRLMSQVDTRLSERLVDARATLRLGPSAVGKLGDQDVDEAPIFVWSVGPSGAATALTAGAPSLPRRAWPVGPTSTTVEGRAFRLLVSPSGRGRLVAGESTTQLARVSSAVLAPEVGLGIAVVLVAFAGAAVIGLRASAPEQAARRRQAEFAADASHELRTPLSVIEAEVDLALQRPRSPEDYTAALSRIGREGRRLRSIISDLLWLARADDELAARREPAITVLTSAVAQCADRFQAIALNRHVELRVETAGEDLERLSIRADHEWIDRLVGVLLDNACKFAGPGGHVEVRVIGTRHGAVLQVDDTGPGIPADERRRVFDRFHRGTESAEGAGLGLAIADSVVRASGGSWSIGASPSGGARMQVSWRRVTNRAPTAPAPDLRGPSPVDDPVTPAGGSSVLATVERRSSGQGGGTAGDGASGPTHTG